MYMYTLVNTITTNDAYSRPRCLRTLVRAKWRDEFKGLCLNTQLTTRLGRRYSCVHPNLLNSCV